MSVAQRSDDRGLEGETDTQVSGKLKKKMMIKELEHKLKGAKTAKQIKELEHQTEMLRAAREIEEIEYELEILNTETPMDLKPTTMPIQSAQKAQETGCTSSQAAGTPATESSGETLVLDPPMGLPHIGGCPDQNQCANAANTEPPAKAVQTIKEIHHTQMACAPPSIATGTGVAAQKTAVTTSPADFDHSRLKLQYYRELDLPDDGIELQCLDMDLETMYEVAGGVETELESDRQLLDLESKMRQLSLLGNIHYLIFSRTSSLGDLHNAIDNIEKALQEGASNINHARYARCLKNLITMLMKKYSCTNALDDLNQAIARAKEMITLGSFKRDQWMDLLRMAGMKSLQTMSIKEVEEFQFSYAVAMSEQQNVNQALRCINKFKETDDINDLRVAIKASGEVMAGSQNPREKANVFVSIANLLGKSHHTNSLDLADLNTAIKAGEVALATTHRDDPTWFINSIAMTRLLGTRFEQAGNISDLQTAIKLLHESLERIPDDYPEKLIVLVNLSSFLGIRFELFGNLDDLQMAIKISKENAKLTSLNLKGRYAVFNNLSIYLLERFKRMGDLEDLGAAVGATEEALSRSITEYLEPSQKAVALGNLSTILHTRFENTHNFDDLQKAIEAAEEAVAIMASSQPKKSGYFLQNLSSLIKTRFSQTRNFDDLQSAIQISEKALALLDPARDRYNPNSANILITIADNFLTKFDETGVPSDFEKAINLCKRATECISSPPERRYTAAWKASTSLANRERWAEASRMAEVGVKLLPRLAPRQLKQQDQQRILKAGNPGVNTTSVAAAFTLEAGENADQAVQLLELGRGVITGLRSGARTDLSELKLYYPEMAENFERWRDILDSRTMVGSLADSLERINARNNADLELEKIIDQIRQLPNFKNFMLPPDANDLMAAASKGPVVLINVSQYRCDAFLVESHAIRSVRLPGLRIKDIKKNAQFMKSIRPTHAPDISDKIFRMLEWMWDTIVNPVLNELKFTAPPTDGEWPHVWWIPTGELSLLPLHAAGYHSQSSINGGLGTCSTPNNTTIDRVVSSYSSSIKALIYSRQNSRDSKPQSGEALLVAMDKTPKNPDLKYAAEEVNTLERVLSSQIKTVKLERPSKQAVLDSLKSCSIFHFAGHGELDPFDPSQSSLLVDDWQQNPLTVENLNDLNLKKNSPLLAYLSACSTSNNSDDELQDEAIHLVTACQLAGFRHVVGSLWEVSDMYSVTAAEEVYKTMMEDGHINADKIALGVHRATRLLRDITSGRSGVPRLSECEVQDDDEESMARGPRGARPAGYKGKDHGLSSPLIWAPYIHVGG